MIDIRYFLDKHKSELKAAAQPSVEKRTPVSSPVRRVVPPWSGLSYLGLPGGPPDESAAAVYHRP